MDYEALERVLGHTFQDKALLETALPTPRSQTRRATAQSTTSAWSF